MIPVYIIQKKLALNIEGDGTDSSFINNLQIALFSLFKPQRKVSFFICEFYFINQDIKLVTYKYILS